MVGLLGNRVGGLVGTRAVMGFYETREDLGHVGCSRVDYWRQGVSRRLFVSTSLLNCAIWSSGFSFY